MHPAVEIEEVVVRPRRARHTAGNRGRKRLEWSPMRLYVSFPMTRANTRDLHFRTEILRRLDAMGVDYYNPAAKDERDLSMADIQEADFQAMAKCDAQLALWSETSYRSCGLLAELEWARRVFNIPSALLCQTASLLAPSWVAATARGQLFTNLEGALACLEASCPTTL